MNPLFKKALIRTFGFFLCASFSAWLFVLVEKTEKDDVMEKYQVLHSLYESMVYKYNMSIEEFNNFSSVAYEALSEPKPQWTYNAALDFVLQALTTIGYGYITPQTPGGQISCIFVCLIGIPITMLALTSIGEVIVHLVNALVTKFEKKILKRPAPTKVQTKSAVILFLLMIVLTMIGGLVEVLKNWTLVEGVYFWFVTLTTIGFGDFLPYKTTRRIRKLSPNGPELYEEKSYDVYMGMFLSLQSILGLCVVSSVLNSIMAAIEESKCHPRCPGCVPRNTQDHMDIEQNNTPSERDADMTYLEMENIDYQKENITTLSVNEITSNQYHEHAVI